MERDSRFHHCARDVTGVMGTPAVMITVMIITMMKYCTQCACSMDRDSRFHHCTRDGYDTGVMSSTPEVMITVMMMTMMKY